MTQGRLDVVGLGISIPRHTSKFTESQIRHADQVYYLVAHPVAEEYLEGLNPKARSLQRHYHEQSSRPKSYRAMTDEVVSAVAAGQRVVLALYGHPNVFASISKWSVNEVRALGLPAQNHPGIGADDCLIADLNIDPGNRGMSHFEAGFLSMFQVPPTPHCYMVLWQIAVAGDTSCTSFEGDASQRQVLVDKLLKYYPEDHPVCLYEAATLPVTEPRMDWVALKNLARAPMKQYTTAVMPPCEELVPDEEALARLGATVDDIREKISNRS
ncbi:MULTISPECIES: SAM-dependent methyltransferase [Ferrimonas]|uniref:SAM-dependent methyltransferase n=1 Tax=Ferrimonas TaxID=44011 RepID=UPI000422864A|nr:MULTISPECIES: SAM-dependent methyltransferase [Ferrimonas]USD39166.1 hypothetical protein J8Z22_08730 [Ferrimonas sp. SCSIO 43195]